ncbi:hypothetical protein [Thiocapsa rosea]|uniref:Repeat protein (TIGR01451 family) n=1 Tax=Thiocapsa rosea TaxID=69360 RepID=A0A495VBN0_9GAMM|nr:hypothetical protein [Thiocapsa rosea]RKT45777.1 hypothetical protein BDD21_3252 [Thiocapsa rosea]
MKQVSVSQQMPRVVTSATLALSAIALLCAAMMPQISAAASVTPTVVDGNPTCTSLGYTNGYKPQPEPPPSDTYTYPGSSYTVTIDSDGFFFDWTSEIDVDAVIVKGGPNANEYKYVPAAMGDTGLSSPINPNTGQPYAISHIEFCYTDLVPPQASLTVIKTADTTFDRAWTWEIDKSADQTELTLMPGQAPFTVNYSVDVDATPTDGEWAVSGLITIDNIGTIPANIASVTDVVSDGIAADVDCGVTFPYSLPADDSLECTYSTGLPDASDRVNTATVTATNATEPFTATADVLFSETPTNESDECIDVTDTNVPPLGTVCADEAPKTFLYSLTFGTEGADVVLECGETIHINTAAFLTNDTETTGSADWTVTANVECEFGCTLTQGYWKTHSEFGKAPYDDNWANLPSGASTPFFLSGQTYYQVFWTPPAGGNVYYSLAHQWIAAELNVLNGASIPDDVLAAWKDAKKNFFKVYTPAQAAGLKGAVKSKWQGIASVLDGYNNGRTGPGHCSEDSSSE